MRVQCQHTVFANANASYEIELKKWIEWTINVNYGIHIATNRTNSKYKLTIKLFYWCAHICNASIKSYNFVIFFSFIIVQCTGYLKRVWIVTVDRGGIIMLSRNTLNTLCFITAHSYVRYWRYLAFLNNWLIKYKSTYLQQCNDYYDDLLLFLLLLRRRRRLWRL